jgi:hypothetical protein
MQSLFLLKKGVRKTSRPGNYHYADIFPVTLEFGPAFSCISASPTAEGAQKDFADFSVVSLDRELLCACLPSARTLAVSQYYQKLLSPIEQNIFSPKWKFSKLQT